MRTLAAAATVCVCFLGAGLWLALDRPAAPELVTLLAPSGEGAAKLAGLEKFKAVEPPAPLPELSFLDGRGNPADLAGMKGRVVLLNLWATWCGPCVKEMPALDRLQAQLGGADFEVVALSLDRGGKEQVEPFYQRTGVKALARYYDMPGAAMRVLSPRGLPTTLLIDREGREIGRIEGAVEWDAPEVVAFLRKHMG